MSCELRDYEKLCCGGIRPNFPTGHVQNGYVRRVDGRFVRQDGVDLTSGFSNRFLVHPNGSRVASQIFDTNEAPLCCD